MKLNFKKKVMLLFSVSVSVVLSLGNVALAGCQIKGNQGFTIKLALRQNPSQSIPPRVEIECDTPTMMTARRNQPPEWNTFVNRISSNVRDSYSGNPLPLENISATFRVVLIERGWDNVREWRFDMARTDNILRASNGDSYELKAGVKYEVQVDSISGVISLPFNPAPYHFVGLGDSGPYLDLATASSFSARGDWSSDVRPPDPPPTCTERAFTVTVPETVNFKILDAKSLEAGKRYEEPFEITISRNRSANCKATTLPWIVMVPLSGVVSSDLTEVKIPNTGLIAKIYQKRTNTYMIFGRSNRMQNQVNYTPITEQYTGYIAKDPDQKVQSGKFTLAFSYRISYD